MYVIKAVSMIARCNMTYMTQATYLTGTSPTGLAVVDVNGDNKPDIIVTNNGNSNVGVLLNVGNDTFAKQTICSTGSKPVSLVVVDVNNDTKPDIINANSNSNTVGVLLAF
ncbi:unnamed protein product [Adineta steineri]|uniref:VCBS repeat-containing protein n=1 Tax=Adineta steineri TaxID=433720 RepID=A0A815BE44_9BILA|nr:unnamed protein product [Adineta steineri]CAF1554509.1 unnamed protein product [Adineta steineri]